MGVSEAWNKKCLSAFALWQTMCGIRKSPFKCLQLRHSGTAKVLLVCSFAFPVYSQISVQTFNPISSESNGIHLYNVNVATSYASNAYGAGVVGLNTSSSDSHLTMMQGAASFGWSNRAEKSNFSITYSPSYVQSFRASNYTSLNHSMSMSFGRALGRKWTLGGSASGLVNDFQQLVFAQSPYGGLASVPASFDELFAAILTGRSTNVTLSQLINAAPLAGSPESAFLYGGRLFSLSASASLGYAISSRSTISGSFQAIRSQSLNDRHDAPGITPRSAVPSTSAGVANLGWTYALSPRTTVGVSLSSARTLSAFQDAYSSSVNLTIGRALSRRWFVQGSVGAGSISPVRETFNPTRNVQHQFGAGLGYKLYAHTFVGSYSRSISDAYGLGANATEASTAAWTWKRPGRGISVSAAYGYSRLIGPAFPTPGSWSGQIAVSRVLNDHLVMSAGFSYAQFPRSILISGQNSGLTGVNVSLNWSPSARR